MAHASNAIVQMMIAKQKQQQEALRMKQEQQQHQDLMKQKDREGDLNERKFADEQKRLDADNEYRKNTVENATALLHAHLDQQHNESIKAVQDALASGVKPSAYQKPDIDSGNQLADLGIQGKLPGTGTPLDQVDIPGVGRRPVAAFPTQEQAEANKVRQMAAQAGGVASATAEANQPYLDATAERTRKTEEAKQEKDRLNRLEELQITGANAINTAKIHNQGIESAANIRGAHELAAAKLKSQLGGMDDQGTVAFAQKQHEALMNGQINYKDLDPIQKRLADGYSKQVGEVIPSDGKEYNKTLDSIKQMQDIVNLGRHMGVNYSRDAVGASQAGNQNVTLPVVGTMQRTVPGSDLEASQDSLGSMSGLLAKGLEGQSRTSDANIVRQGKGIFDPKATKQQNLQKVNDHIKQLQGVIQGSLSGMSPDRINSVLRARGISDFGAYSSNQKAGGPTVGYTHNGEIYQIPQDKEQDFLKARPGAQKIVTPMQPQVQQQQQQPPQEDEE